MGAKDCITNSVFTYKKIDICFMVLFLAKYFTPS